MTTESLPQGLTKTRYEELEVGDSVVIQFSTNSSQPMRIVKIMRISPTRQFALEGGIRFTANGREIGGDMYHFKYMYPLGYLSVRKRADGTFLTYYQLAQRSIAAHADYTYRIDLRKQIMNLTNDNLLNLSADQLERILAICKEGKQDGNQK